MFLLKLPGNYKNKADTTPARANRPAALPARLRARRAALLLAGLLASGPVTAASDLPPAANATHPPAAASPRVISLAPHITELIFAAGAGAHIVGITTNSNYPPQTRNIPPVGDGLLVNAETLLMQRPDLILAWSPTPSLQALAPVLSAAGVSLQYVQPATPDEIPDALEQMGRLFGTDTTATQQAAHLRDRLATLRQQYAGQAPVSVFLDLGGRPLYTLGNAPLYNSLLAVCGGTNPYAQASLPALQVSPEDVLAQQPDTVLIAAPPSGRALHTPWHPLALQAARQGRLHYLDPDTLLRPGPRLIEAAEHVCQYLAAARQAR